MHDPINKFCFKIAKNNLNVQGAGGNISWKDDGVLWIKASGKWISNALDEDIFIPVDLMVLRQRIKDKLFDDEIKTSDPSKLKPSIETFLHAMIPQKIVLHLHQVDILSLLVTKQWKIAISAKLGNCFDYAFVPYLRPGSELAIGVKNVISQKKDLNILFLQNHGIVIGGDTIQEIQNTLDRIVNLLSIEKKCSHYQKFSPLINDWNPYVAIECEFLQGFAFKDNLFLDLASKWALYPDHIVFLGEYANRYNSFQDFEKLFPNPNDGPEIIFIKNVGVFSNPKLNEAKLSQLKCYYNVLMRLHRDYIVNELTPSHRYQLVNWDAEKYRKSIMK